MGDSGVVATLTPPESPTFPPLSLFDSPFLSRRNSDLLLRFRKSRSKDKIRRLATCSPTSGPHEIVTNVLHWGGRFEILECQTRFAAYMFSLFFPWKKKQLLTEFNNRPWRFLRWSRACMQISNSDNVVIIPLLVQQRTSYVFRKFLRFCCAHLTRLVCSVTPRARSKRKCSLWRLHCTPPGNPLREACHVCEFRSRLSFRFHQMSKSLSFWKPSYTIFFQKKTQGAGFPVIRYFFFAFFDEKNPSFCFSAKFL